MSLKGIRSRFRAGGADSDQGSPSRSSFFHQLASFLGPEEPTKGSTGYSQEVFIHTFVFPQTQISFRRRSASHFDGCSIIYRPGPVNSSNLSPLSTALCVFICLIDDQHRDIYIHLLFLPLFFFLFIFPFFSFLRLVGAFLHFCDDVSVEAQDDAGNNFEAQLLSLVMAEGTYGP